MHRLTFRRALIAICIAALAVQWWTPCLAQAPPAATPPTPVAADSLAAPASVPAVPDSVALDRCRQLIRSGDYDQAIGELKSLIGKEKSRIPVLREAYMLVIRTYVFVGNDLEGKPNGREQAKLNYREASGWISECLKVKELRHTQPDPESDPQKMVELFAEVRGKMFGSFTVTSVIPASSLVLLDSDTLRVRPGTTTRREDDLMLGPHVVLVRAPGYMDKSEDISIQPGMVVAKSYELKKKRGKLFYAGATVAAAGVTALVVALTKNEPDKESPLPEAPPPPSE